MVEGGVQWGRQLTVPRRQTLPSFTRAVENVAALLRKCFPFFPFLFKARVTICSLSIYGRSDVGGTHILSQHLGVRDRDK